MKRKKVLQKWNYLFNIMLLQCMRRLVTTDKDDGDVEYDTA